MFLNEWRRGILTKERRCVNCGATLTDEDVMKMEFEDGSCEIIPLPVCPDCFVKRMSEREFR